MVYVHRLVAAAFIGPCPIGQQVCHGPAGELDNSVSNLYHGSRRRASVTRKYLNQLSSIGGWHQGD
ncbi:hypothetical protein LCGC14_2092100 [marine sediment metagenome]|uniref:HNH nuclease domain-containing protein n=1 Tax=marine sediment metagenome TaxID=412755 RepID=A0A0F9EZT1_9ZZZZ